MLCTSLMILLVAGISVGNCQQVPVVLQDAYPNETTAAIQLDITLIGANGDLAKKYLWKGLFDFFRKYATERNNKWNLRLTGAGLRDAISGAEQLNATLKQVLHCQHSTSCLQAKDAFIKQVKYIRLKTADDYQTFCTNLVPAEDSFGEHCYSREACKYERIFYLSVPPFTYKTIAESISKYCHPSKQHGALKVILEKPFGHNQESANQMAKDISQLLKDEEVFRVDHYLGKQAVQNIVSFRQNNPKIDGMLNREFVDRMEIVMKEHIGVKGRTAFYDEYGVICDVMQNHLSELLYLIALDLPSKDATFSGDLLNKKRISILQQIQPLGLRDVILGQYEGYQEEVAAESFLKNSTTPTFAGALVKIVSNKWRTVPIILMAGKKMDERVGYVRVVFKDRKVSAKINKSGCPTTRQLFFHIGHGILNSAAILVSRDLPMNSQYVPDDWVLTSDYDNKTYLGIRASCFHIFVPKQKRDAYSFLIEQLLLGHREHFVSTKGLTESWKIWSPVAQSSSEVEVRIYPGENKTNNLDFTYNQFGLSFTETKENKPLEQEQWIKQNITSGSLRETVVALADAVEKAAQDAVAVRNAFHLAVSGGSTPLHLFQHLTTVKSDAIPWEKVHIWQVDERCSLDPDTSNFKSLCRSLIDQLPGLKYQNIHPMRVDYYPNKLCPNESAEAYERDMSTYIGPSKIFDFVVLGVGNDGHTASLFPQNKALGETERYVSVVEDAPVERTPRRLTITFPAILSARQVVVFVAGRVKCKIISELDNHKCDQANAGNTDLLKLYPVCHLINANCNISWFITRDAFCK